ncbi:MAG: MarR family transcriptional regulator [Pseudomonadota bacterium]
MSRTPQHDTAWHALARAYSLTRGALETAFKAESLPGLEVFEALHALESANQDLTAKALEDVLQMPQYGVSRLLDRMEKDGLIKRVAHKSDGRAKLVQMTETGRTTLADLARTRKRALADFFGPRAKPGQLDRMVDLLSLLDTAAD